MSIVRLYQRTSLRTLFLLCALAVLVACSPKPSAQSQISVSITTDGATRQVQIDAGGDVAAALDAAGLTLGPLDRTEPELYSALSAGDKLRVIRVSEQFEVEQKPMPFESRTLKNESMSPGDQRLIQNGANGLQEITYRLLYEDGVLISRTPTRTDVLTAPVDEIIMVGAESPFSSVAIPGRLAFLSAGNAWVLEQNSGNRRPVVTSGDLDGRIFEVSPDGEWLLFSRTSALDSQINELWVASLDDGNDTQIDLGVKNVVHYAGWVPGSKTQIAFSTAEPSLNPPGWQANNDLQFINFTKGGEVTNARVGLPPNGDSLYSWWGADFAYSAGGELAFARPDAVGTADINSDALTILLPLTTYQTNSEWVWVPGIAWSADGNTLYTVEHAKQTGAAIQEQSPFFDLVALGAKGKKTVVAQNVGMFAQPVPEPDGGQVAYLRALTPSQSDISAYELVVAAPDSGATLPVFPPQGAAGLQPQRVTWSPSAENGPMIAFIYQGNLWVANILSGETQQLTGDALVAKLSWGE